MAAVMTEVPETALPKKPSALVCTRVAPNAPLTGLDLCDCSAVAGDKNGRPHLGFCSALALVRVTLITGGQILFCGHHYAKHGPKITRVAVVHNEREHGVDVSSASVTSSQRTPQLGEVKRRASPLGDRRRSGAPPGQPSIPCWRKHDMP